MDPPFEISGDVGDRLAPSQRHVGLQRDDLSAQLAHGDFEGGPRPKRRLFEQHRHVPAREHARGRSIRAAGALRLHPERQLEAAFEIDGFEVGDRQEVLSPRDGRAAWVTFDTPR